MIMCYWMNQIIIIINHYQHQSLPVVTNTTTAYSYLGGLITPNLLDTSNTKINPRERNTAAAVAAAVSLVTTTATTIITTTTVHHYCMLLYHNLFNVVIAYYYYYYSLFAIYTVQYRQLIVIVATTTTITLLQHDSKRFLDPLYQILYYQSKIKEITES